MMVFYCGYFLYIKYLIFKHLGKEVHHGLLSVIFVLIFLDCLIYSIKTGVLSLVLADYEKSSYSQSSAFVSDDSGEESSNFLL